MGKHNTHACYVRDLLLARSHQDRRRSTRYVARPGLRTRLAWLGPDGRHIEADAGILNLSLSGALLDVEKPVPVTGPAWLRLVEPEPSDWIPAQLVSAQRSIWRKVRGVRISFIEPCPFTVFKRSIQGFETEGLSTLV